MRALRSPQTIYILTLLLAAPLLPTENTLAADAAAVAPASLTAAQIVERNVQARGGLTAWRKVSALLFQGQLDAGGTAPTTLPVVLEFKRPNKERVELQFQDKTAIQVFDGIAGWKVRPYLGRMDPEPFTADELKEASEQSELDGPLMDYVAKGTQVALEGTENIEGRNCYRLKLTLRNASTSHVWIDADTFLESKVDAAPRRVDGRLRHVETYFRDYRKVDGLLVPFLVETAVEGIGQRHRMSFTQVQRNPPLEDALFARQGLALASIPGR